MKALVTALLLVTSLNACAATPPVPPTDQDNTGLSLSANQQENLRTLLGLQPSSPFSVQVEDTDANGQLSAGDTAIMSGGFANAEISRRILSASDIAAINTTGKPHAAAAQQLQAAQARWNPFKHAPYRYTLQRSCFCAPEALKPMTIDVRQGNVYSATVDGQPLSADRLSDTLSIEQLFEKIQQAIDRNVSGLSVEYDPTFGYPTDIYIDYEAMMADEELSLKASNFKPYGN